MPRVKFSRRGRKPEYIHTELCRQEGSDIVCLACGYNGKADLVRSTALGCGVMDKCPNCRSLNFRYKESDVETKWKQDEWKGCYPSSWKGVIVSEAMAHPAKFSSKLIRRIYDHMRAEGWVKTGDRVIDPFGGVALGALDAMRLGLEWLGMELEVKFVDLGNRNISNWVVKFGKSMPNWGNARLVQGDSRKLLETLGRGRAAVSSPPYAETELSYKKNGLKVEGKDHYERPYMDGQSDENYGTTPGQLGGMKGEGFDAAISSPPFTQSNADGGWQMLDKYAKEGKLTVKQAKGDPGKTYPSWAADRDTSYGESEGQLSKMDEGNFAAAMRSSPPYSETEVIGDNNFKSRSNPNGKEARDIRDNKKGYQASVSSPPFLQSEGGAQVPSHYADDPTFMRRHAAGNGNSKAYGGADGQLGNMREGDFDGAVSSPPFMDNNVNIGSVGDTLAMRQEIGGSKRDNSYGFTDGQLGNDSDSDFWSAARQIVEQVYLALAPGGHAVWVCKRYVKNKEIVEFSDQWRQLCEAVGFKTIHWHRALLVHSTSYTLDGGEVRKESKSFFRRLAEKKHSPRIDWEDVLCMQKPTSPLTPLLEGEGD